MRPVSLLPPSLLLCAVLTACGGEAPDSLSATAQANAVPVTANSALVQGAALPSASPIVLPSAGTASLSGASTVSLPNASPVVLPSASTVSLSGVPLPAGSAAPSSSSSAIASVTTLQLVSTATVPQVNVPVTFGQVFAVGEVRPTDALTSKTATGASVPLQVDVKATHADGSVRHAVLTALLPTNMPGQNQTLHLVKNGTAKAVTAGKPAALLNSGFTAAFNATLDGKVYTASADALLKAGKYTNWLAGPLTNEWMVSAPLKTAQGVEHPHLAARFAIRYYPNNNSARVDVTIENGWAYEAAPQNFTYNAQILVGGKETFAQVDLTHFHHARWRKTYWWGNVPQVNVRHNTAYLIASKAVPNYDQTLKITDSTLATLQDRWSKAKTAPMENGLAAAYMPTTGARRELGLMPSWNATYLLTMDPRAKTVALGMSELAGGWPAHYRNKITGRPVSLADFPYMSSLANAGAETLNPQTKLREATPACPTALCTAALVPDPAHQPAFAYLPYLVTGDYYHLEELQFWANWNSFNSHASYREFGKGLVKPGQIRAQAWMLRSYAEAAYITPDNDPLKAHFKAMVEHNIDWYDANYTNNPDAVKFGALTHGYAMVYDGGLGLGPWQDDFFTSAVGYMLDLGFTRAKPLLTWKSTFPVERMGSTDYCWIQAGAYSLKVRDSATAPFYSTMREIYQANFASSLLSLECGSQLMASALGLRASQMAGYVTADGANAIYQPALAYSVQVNSAGRAAWDKFQARANKPDYSTDPQFAIVPR